MPTKQSSIFHQPMPSSGQCSYFTSIENNRTLVIRQNISYPLIHIRTYQRVRNVHFSENLACFVLETPVLRFAFLAYYRRVSYRFSGVLRGYKMETFTHLEDKWKMSFISGHANKNI